MLKHWILGTLCGSILLAGAAAGLVLSSPPGPARSPYFAEKPEAPLERIDTLEAVRSAVRPHVGERAQPIVTVDEVGAPFNLEAQYTQRPVLLGAFCACTRCRETAAAWEKLLRRHPGQFTAAAIVALPKGDPIIEFDNSLRLSYPLLPDPNHALSSRFPGPGSGSEALRCPRAWVIGRDGRYRSVMPMAAAPTARVLARIAGALGLKAP